jgi:hypothetical protein
MRKTCILILGMHRSGTSALSGTLSLLNVYLGNDLLDANIENEKGYFENRKLFQINEEILYKIESSWDDLFYVPSKLESLGDFPKLEKTILEEFENSQVFAIKDPRLPYLFPLYENVLNKLNIDIKIIIPYRNPLEVAQSLQKRNAFSLEKGMLLWAYNLLISEKYSQKYQRVFIAYEQLLSDAEDVIRLIYDHLEIDLLDNFKKNKDLVYTFLEPNLKHHNVLSEKNSVQLPKIINDVLVLESSFNSDKIRKQFDLIRKELFDYKNLFHCKEVLNYLELLKLREEELEECKHEIKEKNRHIEQINNVLELRNKELSKLVNNINNVTAKLLEKDSKIDALTKDVQILSSKIEALKNELVLLYTSHSWKITRPLRMIRRFLQ